VLNSGAGGGGTVPQSGNSSLSHSPKSPSAPILLPQPSRIIRYKASLMIHEQRYGGDQQEADDLILNPKYFLDVRVGDILQITPASNSDAPESSGPFSMMTSFSGTSLISSIWSVE
jgi:hypothetical protein